MYRSHTCGELRASHIGQTVTLAGWVQRSRELGGMTFLDLRDRYGITQVAFNEEWDATLLQEARQLGREWVVQIEGEVIERHSKNANMPTGDVEIKSAKLKVLNAAKTPPFTIEEESDGGEELRIRGRMKQLSRVSLEDAFTIGKRNHLDPDLRLFEAFPGQHTFQTIRKLRAINAETRQQQDGQKEALNSTMHHGERARLS